MAVFRKKDGAPTAKFYESSETIELFEPVKKWLNKNTKTYPQVDPPTNKYLANLCYQLLLFQEDAFGKNKKSPPLTKIPHKCCVDFSPGGGLCHILGALLKYRSEQGLRRFDFQNPSRMDRNVEIFMMIEKTLVQSGILVRPIVYFSPEIDEKERARLTEIIQDHHGTVADDAGRATHILHPTPDSYTPTDDYITPVERRDKQCLVHYWGFPDSYDTWIPATECPTEKTYNIKTSFEIHHICAKWVCELETYNEWMNELDYQVTESGEQVLPSSSERKEFWKTCLNVALMALLLSDGRELNLYQQIPNSSK